MYTSYDNQIIITRGDTGFFNIEITDDSGDVADLTDATVVFSVKKSTTDKNTLIAKTGTNIQINPDDTAQLEYGQYVYDVQVTYDNGDVDTVITPTPFIIAEEVTF